MKSIVVAGLLLLTAACAAHGVRCDGPLRPIANASARTPANGPDALPR